MDTIFMNSKNSKTDEPNKFRLYLTDKINLKNKNKTITLVNTSAYYTWKNVKEEYNNNKFKITAPSWERILVCQMDHIQLQLFKTIFRHY